MNSLICASWPTGDLVALGVTTVVLLVTTAPVLWLAWRFVAMDDRAMTRSVEDVKRFVELTDQARHEWAATPTLPLLDPAGERATTAAINRFADRKTLAREALYRPLAPPPRQASAR